MKRKTAAKRAAAAFVTMAVMLASVFSAAADVDMVGFPTAKAYKGCNVSVSISGFDIPNICGLHLRIGYDESKLKLASVETHIGHESYKDFGGTIEWSTLFDVKGVTLTEDNYIVTFEFTALDDITVNDKYLSVGVVEAYDYNENDVDFLYHAKAVSKSGGIRCIMGDADRNGAVDSADALLILRSSAGLAQLAETPAFAADVDKNDTVDSSDALAVLRHSVGFSSGVGSPVNYGSVKDLYFNSLIV